VGIVPAAGDSGGHGGGSTDVKGMAEERGLEFEQVGGDCRLPAHLKEVTVATTIVSPWNRDERGICFT
jgi:hypothetical protein